MRHCRHGSFDESVFACPVCPPPLPPRTMDNLTERDKRDDGTDGAPFTRRPKPGGRRMPAMLLVSMAAILAPPR